MNSDLVVCGRSLVLHFLANAHSKVTESLSFLEAAALGLWADRVEKRGEGEGWGRRRGRKRDIFF